MLTVKVALVAPAGDGHAGGHRARPAVVGKRDYRAARGRRPVQRHRAGGAPERPPTTLVGFRVSDVRTAGSTVSDTLSVAPP